MPTVLRVGSYRFYFYSNEGHEPPHIHVSSPNGGAKFWLSPVQISYSRGYNDRELRQIERIVAENASMLLATWIEFFGADDA